MNPKSIKTISTAILTTLIILSILPAALFMGLHAQQGEIKLSSANLNPMKFITIEVFGNFGDGPITLRVLKPDGTVVTLEGDVTTFEAVKIGTRYVAYLGGSTSASYPQSPLSPIACPSANCRRIDDPTVTKGTTLTIEVVGTDVRTTVNYDTVVSKTTLGVKEVAYRRLDVVIPITIEDQDLNYDPTYKDEIDPADITVTLRLIKAEGGEVEVSTSLDTLGAASLTETAVNSGKFTTSISLSAINDLLGGRPVFKDDKVLLEISPSSDVQGGSDWSDAASSSDMFTAVYRKPSISITITSQRVIVDIISPDDNANPNTVDSLDSQDLTDNGVCDTMIKVSVSGASYTFDCGTTPPFNGAFKETGANSGVFRQTFSVSWGTTAAVTASSMTFPIDASSISVKVEYTMNVGEVRADGYNVDVSGSASFTPAKADVSLVKATVKTIALTVTDSDLNTGAGSVEYLEASFATSGRFDLNLNTPAGVPVARIQLKDIYGNLVSSVAGCDATDLISFVETDFNTGVFSVKVNAQCLEISAGASYTLIYTDRTGPSYVVTLPVKIAPLAISLDRTEYPVNRNGVVVRITLENDLLNTDPSRKEPAPASISITSVTGSPIWSGSTTLTETDIDSGVFSGSITIPSTAFATPSIIDATLTVTSGDLTATARFRAHDASIEVDKTVVAWGDTIAVKVKDPDANRDSKSKDSVDITIAGLSKSCSETDINSGEFVCTFVVAWDGDGDIFSGVEPASTITVRYVDYTPIMSPTAATWRTVPYASSFKVKSFDGSLTVPTVEKGFVGALEEFDVVVKDPDLNRYMERADNPDTDVYVRDVIAVAFEGIPITPTYDVSETGINTNEFRLSEATGYMLSLIRALADAGMLPPTLTPRQRAELMAQYIGKKVTISYIDSTDATGARKIVSETLVIKAWDAVITTDKDSINLGEWLVINITNKDVAGTTVPEYKMVIVRSDSYPAGLMFYLEEVTSGVFQLKIQVVGVGQWIPGAKQIPAKLGDKITIEYVDPITADGKAYVTFTKTVAVGVFVEMPGKAEAVKTVDVVTGAVVVPKVNREVFLTVSVRNTDIVERSMAVIVVVRDPAGVAVARYAASFTLGAGASTEQAFGWIPIVSGSHTVEIYIVRSLADRTPVGEPATFTVSVEA
jgi:hypothetical protein